MGQALSALGNGISPVALTLLLLSQDGNGVQLGVVLSAQSIGLIGLVLVGGYLADRMRRTRVMAASDLLRAGAAFGFALLAPFIGLPVFVLLALAMGAGAAMFTPAARALLPSLVPDEDLQPANALNVMTAKVGTLVGPPLGGVLAAAFDPRIAFAIDGVTFVVSAVILLTIRTGRPREGATGDDRTPKPTLLRGGSETVRVLRDRPWVATVIIQGGSQVLLVHAPMTILVPLALRDYGALDAYGVILALQSVGSLAGAFLVARWTPREPGTVALLSMLTSLPTLLVLVFHLPVPLLMGSAMVSGAGGTIFAVLWTSALQRRVPEQALARVVSVDYVGQLGLEPVGLAMTAPVVALIGIPAGSVVCLAALLLTTGLPFLVRGVRTFGGEVAADGDSRQHRTGRPAGG